MSELVSIIVPVYRAEAYIAETIAMVISQTYRNWELILIDDCSPDGSVEAVRRMLDRYERRSCGRTSVRRRNIPTAREGGSCLSARRKTAALRRRAIPVWT